MIFEKIKSKISEDVLNMFAAKGKSGLNLEPS
jgi:hypothetical protein